MDENIVFGKKDSEQPDPSGQATPVSPTASPTATAAPIAGQAGQVPPSVEGTPPPPAPPPNTGVPNAGIVAPLPPAGNGMKKKLIIGSIIFLVLILLLLFIVVPLFGSKSEKDVKLVWWGLWEDSSVMQGMISDFHREHPHITVEYVKMDKKQYKERLITRIQQNTEPPDIFRFHNTWYPMLSDVLVPLPKTVMKADEFSKVYYPVMQKDLVHNGAIYGIPLGADTLSLFVNTEILKAAGVKAPKNWDDFQKAATKLTVRDPDTGKIKTAGAALGTYDNITHAPDILSLFFTQQEVDIKNIATNPNLKNALEFYTQFASAETQVWDNTLDESVLAFARGNLAMYLGYSWDIFRIQNWNKELSFETYAAPSLYDKNQTIASYWAEGVSAKSPNKKEAFLFMSYLAKKETAQKFYTDVAKTRKFGEPYARRDLAETLKEDKLVYPFVSQLQNAGSMLFAAGTYDGDAGLNTMANTYLQKAINSVIIDNTSPDTAVKEMSPGISQILKKYPLYGK